MNLRWFHFEKLPNVDNSLLVARFEEVEIKEAIWDYRSFKSSGPDQYNFKFIKEFWHLVRVDVIKFLEDFHSFRNFFRGSNGSFITFTLK